MEFRRMTDFEAFTDLSIRCYPGMGIHTKEDRKKYLEHREKMNQKHNVRHLGLYENDQLLGGYIEYNLQMNVYGNKLPTRGIGTVGVDLPFKKQGHAKRILTKFIMDARDSGCSLVHLYPFQPSFYKNMGFGLGPKLHTFTFHPRQLPGFTPSLSLKMVTEEDKKAVRKCYHQWAESTHGANDKEEYEFCFLENDSIHTCAAVQDGEVEGYVSYEFKSAGHFLQNDLHITNFFSTTQEAFETLIHHLYNQKDQVQRIHYPTFDQDFSFLLEDCRHSDETFIYSIYHKMSEMGHGLMYRIVHIPEFLQSIPPNSFQKEEVTIRWVVEDTLLDDIYEGVWKFHQGQPLKVTEDHDVTVRLGISEFSSLMLGCTSLDKLVNFGLAEAEGETEKAFLLFSQPHSPQNWSFF